jgi:hypothetical protein
VQSLLDDLAFSQIDAQFNIFEHNWLHGDKRSVTRSFGHNNFVKGLQRCKALANSDELCIMGIHNFVNYTLSVSMYIKIISSIHLSKSSIVSIYTFGSLESVGVAASTVLHLMKSGTWLDMMKEVDMGRVWRSQNL